MAFKQEIDNSLEYFRQTKIKTAFDADMYVICKGFLGTPIANPQQIIDYLNSLQQADGSWQTSPTERLYPTQRALMAYFILNARPSHSMNVFFSKYSTIQQVADYTNNVCHSDARDVYHITWPWCIYYWKYPPWLDEYFFEVEKDLAWTTGNDYHKTTHILYNYVVKRRPFPNLDGILNKLLSLQQTDGSWPTILSRPVYSNSIVISLLSEILALYPNHRSTEIQAALAKAALWVSAQYRITIVGGVTLGYFGDIMTIEDSLMCGIMCAGQTGILTTNVDMTFQALVNKLTDPTRLPSAAARSIGPFGVPAAVLHQLWRLREHFIRPEVHRKLHPLV